MGGGVGSHVAVTSSHVAELLLASEMQQSAYTCASSAGEEQPQGDITDSSPPLCREVKKRARLR